MIIAVGKIGDYRQYINVPESDYDTARKIAFRYVFKRREKDFNELMHMASKIQVYELHTEAAEILLNHYQ